MGRSLFSRRLVARVSFKVITRHRWRVNRSATLVENSRLNRRLFLLIHLFFSVSVTVGVQCV